MADAPILFTGRLRLRPHVQADFAACKSLWQHPNTIRYITGSPQTDQEVWFRLLRYGGMWPMLGFGFWVFEDVVSGIFLGEGGFLDARRDVQGLLGMPEVGWAMTPEATGKGLATEAMGAALAWADAHLAAQRTGCIISPGNVPSMRVAAKLGYLEVQRPDFQGKPVVLLHRARPLVVSPDSQSQPSP